VANSLVKRITSPEVKDIFGNLSKSNHYLVSFSTLKKTITEHVKYKFGVENVEEFLSRKSGLLCSEASLPTSAFAKFTVNDNFLGIPQEFAHTRLYTDLDFTFYVDKDYKNLRLFEGWMDYISSGSEYYDRVNELQDNYYRRMMYPDDYKVQTMNIIKFEKDYSNQLEYQFINAFPVSVISVPVSYGPSEILKVTVTFNYDRYIINPKGNYRPGKTKFKSIAGSATRLEEVRGGSYQTRELPSIYSIPPSAFPPPPVNLPPLPSSSSVRQPQTSTTTQTQLPVSDQIFPGLN